MFILRAKESIQGKGAKARDGRIVFHRRHEFLDQERLHPENLKKNARQERRRALADTGLC